MADGPPSIPVSEPLLGPPEREALARCIDEGWISSEGPQVRRFEESMAGLVGRRHGIAVANGTAAIDVAVAALGIGPGDEVIVPSFTIISCVLQVVRSGAVPVFVDVDPVSWNVDVDQVARSITSRTRAMIVPHLYGLAADMDALQSLADHHGIHVIEDAAEAHGLRLHDRPCGSFGTLSTFSFYPNKLVTTGEGGMVVTDDDRLADRCRSLRNLCFEPERRFVHRELGWNYRMTNLQAAVGLAQLERLDDVVSRKRHIGHRYLDRLEGAPHLRLPPRDHGGAENVFWVFGIVLEPPSGMTAIEAMQELGRRGIGTRPFFYPLHRQPVLNDLGFGIGDRLPVSEHLGEFGFYVPSGVTLTDAQIDVVATAVLDVVAASSAKGSRAGG